MVSALGLILAVPLAALPASASLPGGGFFVKAQNKSTAGVQAIAGMGTKIVSDPSGGNTGDSRVFASYRCGALSFEVTKEMVDFSKANELLVAQGKWDQLKYHSGGWAVISHYDASAGRMRLGFPADGSKPRIVHLSTTADIPNVVDNPDDTRNTKLMFIDDPEYCSALDLREIPKANAIFYTIQDKTAKEEVRYIEEEGDLRAISSKVFNDGGKEVYRKSSPSSSNPAASLVKPYFLGVYSDGKLLNVLFPTTVDGYNMVKLEIYPDGSSTLIYQLLNNFETLVPTNAKRAQGPVGITFDSAGKVTGLYDANGKLQGATKESYNTGTGQNWNGLYSKPSDFHQTIPFAPSN
jgi:hypothetical protein